jgi:hypothetical protein
VSGQRFGTPAIHHGPNPLFAGRISRRRELASASGAL